MKHMLSINKLEYTEKYNPYFRAVTNQKIITVEISPTGSGKTHFYKNSKNTIMLMPTNAMIREHNGLLSSKQAQEGERYKWGEIHRDKCDYMTYDKFTGHMKREDLSDFNIIIDEAHLLLASDNELYYDLLKALFTRSFDYKELKLLSATLRKEILELYNNDGVYQLAVNQAINTNYKPIIQFTKTLPEIDDKCTTLFFINSKDKMIQIKEHYEGLFPNIKVIQISSDKEIPDTATLKKYNLILSTCYIKQGFNIKCHIDQVIIHNQYNAVGAMELIQYMARPRINQPLIYVIPASTHFSNDSIEDPELQNMITMVESNDLDTEEYQVNKALELNKLQAKAKTGKDSWNVAALSKYYEDKCQQVELFSKDGKGMIATFKQVIPYSTIIIKDILGSDSISFTTLKWQEIKKTLTVSKDISALRDNISEHISNTTDERTLNKLKTLLTIDSVSLFKITEKNSTAEYCVTDKYQVQQALEDNIRKRFKQHITNINKGVYDLRDKQDKRYLPMVGTTYPVGKIGRKISFIKKKFSTKQSNLDILEKMYTIECFDKDNALVTSRTSKTITTVKIVDNYPICGSWYKKCPDAFFRVDRSSV